MRIKINETLDALVVAHCADYFRRKEIIKNGNVPTRVLMELRYLNFRILDAACATVGEDDAEMFILEIGERRGYAESRVAHLSEAAYKIKKQEVRWAIARSIHLTP